MASSIDNENPRQTLPAHTPVMQQYSSKSS